MVLLVLGTIACGSNENPAQQRVTQHQPAQPQVEKTIGPDVMTVEYNFIPGFDIDSLAQNELKNVFAAFDLAGIKIVGKKDNENHLPYWFANSRFPDGNEVALRNYAKKHINESFRYHVLAVNYAQWNSSWYMPILGKTIHISSEKTTASFIFWGDILENPRVRPDSVEEIPEYAVEVVTHELGHAMGLLDFKSDTLYNLHNLQQKNCVMQQYITDIERRYRLRPFFCFDNDTIQTNSCRDNLQHVLRQQKVDQKNKISNK